MVDPLVERIQRAMDAWRTCNDPASHDGPTMAEAIAGLFRQVGFAQDGWGDTPELWPIDEETEVDVGGPMEPGETLIIGDLRPVYELLADATAGMKNGRRTDA